MPHPKSENSTQPIADHHASSIDEAIERACARCAPVWPLDRFIAVNPLWGMIDRPLPEVAAELRALCGARLLMPLTWYQQAWRDGKFEERHLHEVIIRNGSEDSEAQQRVEELKTKLEEKFEQNREETHVPTRARVMDVVDAQRDLIHEVSWREFILNSTSQFCASYFDEEQALLSPRRDGGLFASWRRQALIDKAPILLMGLEKYANIVSELPTEARAVVHFALADLDVPATEIEQYLAGLLLDLNGWASWCMYRRWTARLAHQDDDVIVDLLAIRLAWEWILHEAGGRAVSLRWQMATSSWTKVDGLATSAQADLWPLQEALEFAWQEEVSAGLASRSPSKVASTLPIEACPATASSPSAGPTNEVAVQAVFCIDVRSEVYRRALEQESNAVQTLGFAGFFGLPIAYQPLGAQQARPQLPGLLAPRLRVTDQQDDTGLAARRLGRLGLEHAWTSFKRSALSSFGFVEAMGLSYAVALVADSLGLASPSRREDSAGLTPRERHRLKPRLNDLVDGTPLDAEAKADLAANMLRAMSLTHGFARLVLLAGHGSETKNNPHAAGLDCGACCGQTGEVNARAAAALLNEPQVRLRLRIRGIDIPDTTHFLAGLHNTTTDDVLLFDLDVLPPSHEPDLSALRSWLYAASARAREERATRLGLPTMQPRPLRDLLGARARDWAQVRPEWGLANNAAFIVAPREHCRHLNLEGRAFLHEYLPAEDEGHAILELIMTAPMVVAHWINFQYYASTVDNVRYGSGNKVLHNVVGGHIGVFEGNGGDLRIGLPLQSLHDGERWVHTPLRLSVFIQAPRPAIEAILRKHSHVRALVVNRWLDLFQIDETESSVYAYRGESWARFA